MKGTEEERWKENNQQKLILFEHAIVKPNSLSVNILLSLKSKERLRSLALGGMRSSVAQKTWLQPCPQVPLLLCIVGRRVRSTNASHQHQRWRPRRLSDPKAHRHDLFLPPWPTATLKSRGAIDEKMKPQHSHKLKIWMTLSLRAINQEDQKLIFWQGQG